MRIAGLDVTEVYLPRPEARIKLVGPIGPHRGDGGSSGCIISLQQVISEQGRSRIIAPEPDPQKLAQRIATPEAALAARLRLIKDESDNMAERIAIGNALSALKVLKPVNARA